MKTLVIFSASILLTATQLWSQSLDHQIYGKLREILTFTGHQDAVTLKAGIDSVTNDPVPYLKVLSDEASLRIYAKQKAISAIKFYQTPEAESFLEGKIQDHSLHPSLRKLAARSYTEGFYGRNPQKAETVLKPFENDPKIGSTVRSSLQNARKGSLTGTVPKAKGQDLKIGPK